MLYAYRPISEWYENAEWDDAEKRTTQETEYAQRELKDRVAEELNDDGETDRSRTKQQCYLNLIRNEFFFFLFINENESIDFRVYIPRPLVIMVAKRSSIGFFLSIK